jgi:hypothetical protein
MRSAFWILRKLRAFHSQRPIKSAGTQAPSVACECLELQTRRRESQRITAIEISGNSAVHWTVIFEYNNFLIDSITH